MRERANAELASARTQVQMSRMLGALPDACLSPASGPRTCSWLASNRTLGHGTLAASIGTSLGNRVHLRCRFPKDGSPREPDGCRVSVP
jgi:hypothetical protein